MDCECVLVTKSHIILKNFPMKCICWLFKIRMNFFIFFFAILKTVFEFFKNEWNVTDFGRVFVTKFCIRLENFGINELIFQNPDEFFIYFLRFSKLFAKLQKINETLRVLVIFLERNLYHTWEFSYKMSSLIFQSSYKEQFFGNFENFFLNFWQLNETLRVLVIFV